MELDEGDLLYDCQILLPPEETTQPSSNQPIPLQPKSIIITVLATTFPNRLVFFLHRRLVLWTEADGKKFVSKQKNTTMFAQSRPQIFVLSTYFV